MRKLASLALASVTALALSGCMSMPQDGRNSMATTTSLAYFPKKTQTQTLLNQLPAPQRPVAIAVYGFTDQTGQFKPSETGQTLSRAVTQGASSMLVKALQDAGNRGWFTVVERERLDNLLKERQIIGEMRKRYLGEQEVDPNALPALLFAGVLLEGGIVGYDTNTVTGGAGAAFLGIGARTEYRQDTVTVYLRAVSVRTGEVLANVTASKTIASQALGASAFKFVAFRELLEAEAGITSNEPDQVALQQAIEKAVYGLVLEGVDLDLWRFNDMAAAMPLLAAYRAERDGLYDASDIQKAVKRAGSLTALTVVDGDKQDDRSDGS
ncbi:CsgG/HfaB family protein [Erythrobacter sp. BLCC-B19]|uniref:CsgG/HfaB family protein n=1 Tax=Erythrobacter sp. BLCC-B19 TaxID=3025315 RepID=UPI00236215B1|nr:CsgG/HfaB family protein [Erythrobacter sp. BLCC-B19]WDA42035.1 CsgG/HfaB family protein [Erythrobacter sp. BLCC-B19]